MTVVHRALRAAGQSYTMEDADRLLLLALGRVGCSIPANVRSMADVVTENALPAMCASCLRALDASSEGAAGTGTVSPSPEPYPVEATARIRACEVLAARLNALARSEGFPGVYDAELDTHELAEEALLDRMEEMLASSEARGVGCVVD